MRHETRIGIDCLSIFHFYENLDLHVLVDRNTILLKQGHSVLDLLLSYMPKIT